MYVPASFAASTEQLDRLLSAPGLVELVTPGPDGLVATPLPMLHLPTEDGPGTLQGHVARNNPHWRAAGAGTGGALAVVRGPGAVGSPALYSREARAWPGGA